tara:strand:+ start:247 stop:552 length:306 start_codon:yes stop_codon:yes gene_type:complete
MEVVRNPDGSSSVIVSSVEAWENVQGRKEVIDFAVATFHRQRADRYDVRRRAREADSPEERARCREAVLSTPAPSLEECLRYSRRQRRLREVDFKSTLLDG